MAILVTGATGNVGRNVVDLLGKTGAEIRATSRTPERANLPAGVAVHGGDLAHPETFADALKGVDKVFLFPEPSGVAGFIEVAKNAGVERVVLLSSLAASMPDPQSNPIAMMHLVVEQALEHSGLDWTFVRPGAFAANTLQWAPSIRAGEPVRIPYADSAGSPIHERDIAEVAVRALLDEGHASAKYEITGPEAISQRRQAELIGAAIGRAVQVDSLTGDKARALVVEQFGGYGPPELVDTLFALMQDPAPAVVTDTVQRVTGHPAHSYADWVNDHKATFGG
ncbi:NAD(P)H-binding protein [Sinosporangium siamense]|uniref:Nucleotide-diphosphate-sugar epimerase n=1 Tax=Sinosporangium siamense TaxID=1367973 RepID=A0A919V933_9ACTN|nr:NAD(P)H-binding protein [Sinosporangium siamense]GII95043.1 nucleotide-diphosphate-sugar epimerase [Sinosporangium siamense]